MGKKCVQPAESVWQVLGISRVYTRYCNFVRKQLGTTLVHYTAFTQAVHRHFHAFSICYKQQFCTESTEPIITTICINKRTRQLMVG